MKEVIMELQQVDKQCKATEDSTSTMVE